MMRKVASAGRWGCVVLVVAAGVGCAPWPLECSNNYSFATKGGTYRNLRFCGSPASYAVAPAPVRTEAARKPAHVGD